jgi:hypothetical protein
MRVMPGCMQAQLQANNDLMLAGGFDEVIGLVYGLIRAVGSCSNATWHLTLLLSLPQQL